MNRTSRALVSLRLRYSHSNKPGGWDRSASATRSIEEYGSHRNFRCQVWGHDYQADHNASRACAILAQYARATIAPVIEVRFLDRLIAIRPLRYGISLAKVAATCHSSGTKGVRDAPGTNSQVQRPPELDANCRSQRRFPECSPGNVRRAFRKLRSNQLAGSSEAGTGDRAGEGCCGRKTGRVGTGWNRECGGRIGGGEAKSPDPSSAWPAAILDKPDPHDLQAGLSAASELRCNEQIRPLQQPLRIDRHSMAKWIRVKGTRLQGLILARLSESAVNRNRQTQTHSRTSPTNRPLRPQT